MKQKIIKICNRIIELCLCVNIFVLVFSKAAIEATMGMVIFFWLLKNALEHGGHIRSYVSGVPLKVPLLCLLLWNAACIFFSIDPALSLRGFFGKIFENILFYFAIAQTIRDKRAFKLILIFGLLSLFVMLSDAIFQYFIGYDYIQGQFSEGEQKRLTASFTSPNGFGAWLGIVIPVLMGVYFSKEFIQDLKRQRMYIAMPFLIFLLLLTMLLSGSRMPLIGLFFAAALFTYLYHAASGLKQTRAWISFLIFLLIALAIILVDFNLRYRFTLLLQMKGVAFTARLNIWHDTLRLISQSPLFGYGVNTFCKLSRLSHIGNGSGIYAHNSYLQMTAETGLVGMGLFVWFLLSYIRTTIKNILRQKDVLQAGFFCGILVFLFHSFFDNNLYSLQLSCLFWLVLGLSQARTNILNHAKAGTNE